MQNAFTTPISIAATVSQIVVTTPLRMPAVNAYFHCSDQLKRGLVRAVWTDDQALSTRLNREVAHYTGQTDMAMAIHAGIAAHKVGDTAKILIQSPFAQTEALVTVEREGSDKPVCVAESLARHYR